MNSNTNNNTNTGSICLPEFCQDGMMFQRDKALRIRGTATPGATICAEFDQSGAVLSEGSAVAGSDGVFLATLPPMAAAEGVTLTLTDGTTDHAPLVISDIAVGDIWLAGGQSNMEFFLRYDRDYEQVRQLPRNPAIRLYTVPQRAFEGHTAHALRAASGRWLRDQEDGYDTFSAPAYRFARDIQEATGVPVGILSCNWGGSTASAWVPESVLQTPPLSGYLEDYDVACRAMSAEEMYERAMRGWALEDSPAHYAAFEPLMYGQDRDWQLNFIQAQAGGQGVPAGPYDHNRPSGLYHTMLEPLIPYAIKGVIWYQGETDAERYPQAYDRLMTGLIEDWRQEWQDDLPFLMVQLAPFGVWLECSNENYTVIREHQAWVADHIPNVYLASIMDIGAYYDIHPKQKQEVGRRLALLARGHVYHEEGLLCDAPQAIHAERTGDREIVVTLAHAEGLTPDIGGTSDWDVYPAGLDGTAIQPAQVEIQGDRIVVKMADPLPPTPAPLYLALGWRDDAEIHIHNAAGLSVRPFCLKVR